MTAVRWGLEDVGVRFGDRVALDGVTLDALSATVTAVVGGDGAGKTTALRVLVGTVRPARGSVRRPPAERLGYLPASSGVYPDLSVAENLAFAGAAHRIGREALRRRAEPLLERAGLTGARSRLGGQLSGGMRQKLGLVLALLPGPDLLVLDEPTTGLDPVSRAEMWGLIAAAAAGGAAVVLSTTYVEEAERAASVLVLDEGRPLVVGPADDVVAAIPGRVLGATTPPSSPHRWRRGARWRVWSPDGTLLPGTEAVEADLEDAVTVAALARAARGEAA